MINKILSFVGIFLSISLSISAQSAENENTAQPASVVLPDSSLNVPTEYDNTLTDLIHSWILQYSDKSDCRSGAIPDNLNDSIYIARLQKLPNIMEMPFNNSVRSFIELYTVRKRRQMEYLLGMSDYYFPIFEQALERHHLPLELKYLPIIESALNTTIISRAGAAGLWQFMIATGRFYGLEVNSLVDERCDPLKATDAAARYLKDLYDIYGDWSLVIAAYNCGPGNINKAIRRSGGKRDYWDIYPYLPGETRGYVPIFIAANYAMNYSAEHNICKIKVPMPLLIDTIAVTERIHLEQIAAILHLPLEELKLLNSQYRHDIIPGNIKPYNLCLPINYINIFLDRYDEIIAYRADELVNNRRVETEILQSQNTVSGGGGSTTWHTVKKGQTLSQIAARYGISVKKIQQSNNLKGTNLRVGQKLKITK
ncbi:MAG: transglycosylase SLT domain-containing protein [Paludibacter sp.]|jgi:membrane-bound lytic murein transglycosylase D|nr:transglycosylase SLT domain-containing protein [Paludibacter sp.]